MYCSQAILVNRQSAEGEAAILKCKRWSCEICRPRNRWQVIKEASEGNPTAMLTLTVSNKNYETPDSAARDMVRALVLLRRRLAKEKGIDKLPFIVVFEKHESGWPHMHLLIRAKFIAWGWLKRTWLDLTGSTHVHIRAIRRGTKDAHYISKYIGKDPHAFTGCKRWWRSHNYDQATTDEDTDFIPKKRWEKVDSDLETLIQDLERTGAVVVERTRSWVRWHEEYSWANYAHLRNEQRYRKKAGPSGQRL